MNKLTCPECGSTNCIVKPGQSRPSKKGTARMRLCKNCSTQFSTIHPIGGIETMVQIKLSAAAVRANRTRDKRRLAITEAFIDVKINGRFSLETKSRLREVFGG